MRAQHEFADIVKSLHPVHYETNAGYYATELEPIRGIEENMYVNVENIYSSTPAPTTIQSHHDYDNQCSYIEHDLHLALDDDDNQNDTQSLVSMSNNEYHSVHRPHISPLSPATTPTLVQQPQLTPQPPLISPMSHTNLTPQPQITPQPIKSENCYSDTPVIDNYSEPNVQPENDFFESFPQDDNDSFTYDDLDESCQSIPSDRNNVVDNAIDLKIQEIEGGRERTTNPKVTF